jgi:hypothetical protein
MPTTYEPIATNTLVSSAASITFSTIPATYTDLRLVFVGSYNTATSGEVWLRVNSDTTSNYSNTNLTGDGSSAASNRVSTSRIFISAFNITANQPSLITSDIFSYAGSTYKTFLNTSSQDTNGSGEVVRQVALWRSTAAITTVALRAGTSGAFLAGSTATLYGIKNA